MNKWQKAEQVKRVASNLDISEQLAKELCILAHGDEEIIYEASKQSENAQEMKARIIDGRISNE